MDKRLIDVAKVFQTYITFNGDIDRTAAAIDMPREDVRKLAESEQWTEKIKEWNELRDGNNKDLQVQINRAVNFVQAHRLRNVVDRIIQYFNNLQEQQLIDLLTESTPKGSKFNTRPLTDLVKAAEACHVMSQRALGDSNAPADDNTKGGGSSVALAVMKAMAAAEEKDLGAVAIVTKQLTA